MNMTQRTLAVGEANPRTLISARVSPGVVRVVGLHGREPRIMRNRRGTASPFACRSTPPRAAWTGLSPDCQSGAPGRSSFAGARLRRFRRWFRSRFRYVPRRKNLYRFHTRSVAVGSALVARLVEVTILSRGRQQTGGRCGLRGRASYGCCPAGHHES